jgi:hypothetical protein
MSEKIKQMNENIETQKYFDELVSFIRSQLNEYNLPITRNTLIEDDLGITGEEAEDFLILYSKKFLVDIQNFNFNKYFYEEPGILNINRKNIEPFTVGHLVKAALVGCLNDEVINS